MSDEGHNNGNNKNIKDENIMNGSSLSGGYRHGDPYQIGERYYNTLIPNKNPYDKEPPLTDNDIIKDELVGIIEDGINTIVLNLQKKLGNTYGEVKENAFNIQQLLDKINENVNTEVSGILTKSSASMPSVPNFTKDTTTGKYDVPVNTNYYNYNSVDGAPFTAPEQNMIERLPNEYDLGSSFQALHTDYETNTPKYMETKDKAININTNEGIKTLYDRLNNCQNLEFLYLKKHEEIMKIFAFTINLFDKYKYAIKVILFLLKYLLPKGESDKTKIVLPQKIIKDIGSLLRDEQKIQGVINNMKNVIVDGTDGTGLGLDQNSITKLSNLQSQYSPDDNNLNLKLDRNRPQLGRSRNGSSEA